MNSLLIAVVAAVGSPETVYENFELMLANAGVDNPVGSSHEITGEI